MDKANQNFLKSFNERKQEGYQEQLVPRIDTGEVGTYGEKIYQYDSGFKSFNAAGLATMFLDSDATMLSQSSTSDVATYLLAGLYNKYIQSAMQGISYEQIDLETTKKELMTAATEEYGKSSYSDINATPEKYSDMLDEATTNFNADQYKAMMTTYQASEFSNTLRTNAIQASNADYIKTLNASYEGALQNPLNSLAQFAIKKQLDQGLDQYLQANEHLVKERQTYYDQASNSYKYWTTEKIVSDFYSDKQGDWYRKQSQDYDFLNNDKLQAQYESLGSKTRKSIAQMLGEDIGQAEVDTYSALEQWLAEDGKKELLAGDEKSIEAAIKDLQTQPGLTNISADRLQQMVLTLKTFQDAWDEQYEQTYNRYNSWADALGKPEKEGEKPQLSKAAAEKIQSFKDIFGPEYLSGIQDQYKTILKNASLSDSQREQQVQGLTDIFDLVASIETPEIKNAILQKMQSADLTSINGIYSLIETLANIEDFDLETGKGLDLKNTLKNFSKNLRINVETEINSYFDTMESTAEGFDKALSSATSGMDLKAAKEMADKVGISLKDFTIKDGKFFYDNLGKIEEAYTADAQDRFKDLKDNVQSRYQKLSEGAYINTSKDRLTTGKDLFSGKFSLSEIKDLFNTEDLQKQFSDKFNIDYNEFVGYYEQYETYLKEFKGEGSPLNFVDFIGSQIDDQLAESVKAIEEWQKQTQAISELKNGKFEGFLKTASEWKTAEDFIGEARSKFGASAEADAEAQRLADEANTILKDAISTGDASKLSAENQKKYGKLVRDTYKSVQSSLMTSIFDAIEGGTSALEVTEANEEYLKKLQSDHPEWIEGNIEAGQQVELQAEKILADESNLWSVIQNSYDNEKDRLEAFKNYHDKKYSKNKLTALEGITDGEIAYSDFLDYLTTNRGWTTEQLFTGNRLASETKAYGLAMTASGDYVVENWSQYITQLSDDLNYLLEHGMTPSGQNATIQDINRARAAVQTAQRGQQTAIQDAASDILDNYDDVSIEMQEAMANALGYTSDQLLDLGLYQMGLDGKTKLDVGRFRSFSEGFSGEVQEVLNEQFASIADDYLDNIKDATSMVTSGTSSQSEIAQFKAKAKELGVDVKDEAFKYVAEENAWMLDSNTMREFALAQGKQLLDTGLLQPEEFEDWFAKNTDKALAEAVNVQEFLDKELRTDKDRQKLKDQLVNAGIIKKGYQHKTVEAQQKYADDMAEAQKELDEAQDESTRQTAKYKLKQIKDHGKLAIKQAKEADRKASEEAADKLVENLEAGGMLGVAALTTIIEATGQELTAADVEKAYRAKASKLEEAVEQLEYGIGSIVSGETVQILHDAGYSLQDIGGGSAVITGIKDISEAYKQYYETLTQTNGVTLAALNEAKAKVLETQDGRHKEQAAIDALGDAAGMTYTTFAAILSDAGIELNDQIIDQYTESLGGGKMRIKDFAAFARTMKWDYDSEEYTSAFKSYNDSLIERNKQVEKSVNEELKGLEDIKPGDWLNLTQTEKAIKKAGKDNSKRIATEYEQLNKRKEAGDLYGIKEQEAFIEKLYSEDTLNQLNGALLQFGATLTDGILRLSDDANLIGVAQTLQTSVSAAGIDISDDIADMIQNIMEAYSDLITKGIEGSLTNIEKSDLKRKAADVGIDLSDSDFVQGAEGFELSMNKSIALWAKWGSVNTQQQKKIYKTLSQQLKDNNSNYKTQTAMLSHLMDMQSELNELDQHRNEGNNEYIKQLENERALLKEMLMYGLTHEDQSWNFMSNDAIPDSIDNALNYFANWKTLESSLDTWAGSGTTDLNSFAAALKHVQEVADATGQDFSFMGSKITAGGDAYGNFLDKLSDVRVWDSKNGKWVLDNTALKNILDFNMSLGKKGLSQGLKDNVDQYVQNNADLLKEFDEFTGGLAEVYKSLQDYSDENNGHSFTDFIKTAVDDTNQAFNYFDYDQFTNQIKKNDKAWKNFQKFTNKVTVNGQKWDDAMKGGAADFKEGSDNYKALMGVMKMALSENWDLESDYQAIADQLSQSGFNGEVTLGDIVITAIDGNTIIKKKDGKDTIYYGPDGTPYKSLNDAKDAINRKALDEYQKQFNSYKPQIGTDGNPYTIPGTDYVIEIKDGKVKIKIGGKEIASGDSVNEAIANAQEGIAKQTGGADSTPEENKVIENAKTMTAEGWAASQTAQFQNTEVYKGGQISSQARAQMQSQGLTTAQSIANEYNAAVQRVLKKNPGAKTTADNFMADYGDAIQAEMYASTGLKFDVSKLGAEVTGQDGLVKEVANQVNMTQTAVDVMNGITQAFTSTGEGSVTQALSSAIASAFANEKGLEIPALEIKPESVSLAAETTPSIGDITVSADKITIDGTVEPIAADQIPDGKGKVVYDDSEITIKDILGPDGHGKIIYDDYSIDISNITGPDGHGKIIYDKAEVTVSAPTEDGEATGNVGLAAGNAKACGTLMGELGPELVVSGGRYFVVGQSGPEMVDLADDAIVFNHLQTKSLLEKGTSSTRGRAITNEQNAVAYATGSINGGPAAANVTDVNNKYRGASSIWDAGFNAIKNATKNTDDNAKKSFLKELERWYNWLQQIAHVEKEITYQETLRSKYQNSFNRTGADYYNSQKESLKLLSAQLDVEKDLVQQRKNYLAQRQQELENSPFSTVYRFDERGQIQYQEGAFENFSKLFGTNDQGIPYYTAEQQYDALVAMGMEDYMKYDNSGQEIDKSKDGWQATAVQAFYDKMEKEREEFQSLHDDIMDGEEKIVELQDNQNQILHDIQDNQIAVEQKVLKAVEESRQRAIDDAKDERDAIEKSANTLIDGLNKQLDKERTLYQNQQSADELAALQRRLGILQRSGGSASEIADLQSQIQEKQYDKYFDTQEQQIQAIQDASDAELERLDNQITLMEETLAYEKEFGLLWNEVDEVLKQSPEQIATFIQQNTSEYWGASLEELNKKIQEDLFQIDQFKQFQNVDGGMQALINAYGGNTENTEEPSEEQQNEDQPIESGGGGSKYAENVAGTWKQGEDGRWWYEHNEADEDGKKYTTNNWEKINDKWYYFDEEGWMKTGWLEKNGKWYYFDDTSGEMLANTTKALNYNGKIQNHTFDENGVWTGSEDINNNASGTFWQHDGQKWVQYTTSGVPTGALDYGDDNPAKRKKKDNTEKKAAGGYVNHGLYELGELGTETVLTASQTKVLRDNILSNRPDSLINLLKSYNEAYRGLPQNAYDSISNTTANMVNIEHAEVNLEVEKLADDYDSRRAANTIMDEMLRIASKTKANNSIRR